MKITLNRLEFMADWSRAAMVAPSRSQRPELCNVKVDATDRCVKLIATNLETSVTLEVDGVEVNEPGAALLPLDKFGSILKEFTSVLLTVETKGDKVTVKGGQAKIVLQTLPVDEFPEVPMFDDTTSVEIAPELFRAIVRRTVIATDGDNSRYAFGGIRLETDGRILYGAATDGRRIAKMSGHAEMIDGYEPTADMIIVPAQSMQEAARVFSDLDENETLMILPRPNDILFNANGRTFHARLLEGRFPDWRAALKDAGDQVKIKAIVGPLYSAIRQSAIVADASTHRLTMAFSENTMRLSTAMDEVGGASVKMPITYSREGVSISIDYTFAADILKALPPEMEITIAIEKGSITLSTEDGLEYKMMGLEV